MGAYLNPGNGGFKRITNGAYVDKTGLIGLVNATIDTTSNLTCVSRPRRFGKSYAAQMLCAYYDKTCDSRELFAPYAIARDASFECHLNSYDVIYLDMTNMLGNADGQNLVGFIRQCIEREVLATYAGLEPRDTLDQLLIDCVELTGNKFVAIVDEWDAPIREQPQSQNDYLSFLRTLFKGSGTTARIFAAAYITGILPITKDGSQSAMSDFREYTMVKPRQFGAYVGLTGDEVLGLCAAQNASFEDMRRWYDGYSFTGIGHIYNPNSVMKALEYKDYDSYWTQTSAVEGLAAYIAQDYRGFAKTIAELMGGVEVSVDTQGFANDLVGARNTDDVLTLLVHLGYLAYDSTAGTVRIPNEEIRLEFQRSVRLVDHNETARRLAQSEELFARTIAGDEEAVAAQIQRVHEEETSPLHYNREEDLRSVIKLAYYTYKDHYLQWEELPSGVGFADVVYLPKRDSGWPALVVELKWNEAPQVAIDQIVNKHYAQALEGYGGEILLVGVSYDKRTKEHTCTIQRLTGGAGKWV